jgi:predicted phosphoribosyltransferase/dienelactone hydrolase
MWEGDRMRETAVRFRDRRDAGRRLAARLGALADQHPVVLGLPRGGVPVAYEVAQALDAPLDVLVVRKIGVPSQPELGMGAIGEGGARVLNPRVLAAVGVSEEQLAAVEARERVEIDRRARRYRGDRPIEPLTDRTAVIVDDGLATGGTALAAIHTAHALGARRVVLAVPVGAPDSVRALEANAEVVALETPSSLRSVGEWYEDFRQVSDEEVVDLLRQARADTSARHERGSSGEVTVETDGVRLGGNLTLPHGAAGIVVFAHGSGSSRHSPRNVAVARVLHDAGLGTLLFDLLTDGEAADRANVFDIALLARRLLGATRWLREQPGVEAMPVGYFGASTGAGAALWAAAEPGADIGAVVSRGGRPDLAGPRLAAVRAPTLLIVGSRDQAVLELNRDAARRLGCDHRIEVVAGASHLFEEPGTLDEAARLAAAWFGRHLRRPAAASS